ncbi:hypothetical protein GCM10022419_105820 [Nonomuraea rosea]|uniref:Uncharacterized protein n=1 Tax=Nonomuraea rosea TaxID=638574 RepID=A0ABP6ZEZ8_9ACTN
MTEENPARSEVRVRDAVATVPRTEHSPTSAPALRGRRIVPAGESPHRPGPTSRAHARSLTPLRTCFAWATRRTVTPTATREAATAFAPARPRPDRQGLYASVAAGVEAHRLAAQRARPGPRQRLPRQARGPRSRSGSTKRLGDLGSGAHSHRRGDL